MHCLKITQVFTQLYSSTKAMVTAWIYEKSSSHEHWKIDSVKLFKAERIYYSSCVVRSKQNIYNLFPQIIVKCNLLGSNHYNSTGDSLDHNNGMKFTTYDRDNDESGSNCAVTFKGAWWHRSCFYSDLNGQYGIDSASGIIWYHWRGFYHSLVRAQMMVRRKIKHQY